MSPILERLSEARFPECVSFLRARERRCVTLAGHFSENGKPRYPAGVLAEAFLVSGEAGAVDGVIARTRAGIILHCLDHPDDFSGLMKSISLSLDLGTARCVLGHADGTRFLEGIMPSRPYRSVDYTLMISGDMPDERPVISVDSGSGDAPVAFVRCSPADADALLSLQEGYEREEVVPPGDPFDKKACRILLARALSNQVIYAARVRGAYVAKAGTNARGLEWDQMGGVYTDPEWRGRGIARALMAHVVRERRSQGRKVALFVKDRNETARRVYEDTGFRKDCPFRISYF